MSFQIGDTVGDYQIIGLLGAGGMGKVYKVKNQISDRTDALKVLLPDLADDAELADRFIREIKVLASLNHPNIAGLRTAFRMENQLLMVMEFVEGTTLEERVKAGPIPLDDAVNYIMQVLSALGYAHQHGVIHRDIKPANMMLTPENVIKLMDFGIAKSKSEKKLTQTGTTMGSLYYMSAEQVQGGELDGRSDLYSVGVSLYELVTGSRPFQGKSDFDIMVAQLQQTPMAPIQVVPGLPKALNDIIMISLEKDPAKRFQSAEAFATALGSVTEHAPSGASAVDAFANVPPGRSAPSTPGSTTGWMSTQGPSAPPGSVGGTVSVPGGFIDTGSMPTVMAPQPEAPVAALPPPVPSYSVPPARASKGYRGLYMTLGALIVVAILALAAIQVPRFLKTRANGDQAAQVATADMAKPADVTSNTTTAETNTLPPTGAANSAGLSSSPSAGGNPASSAPSAGNGAPPPVMSGASAGSFGGSPSSASPANAGGAAINNPKKATRTQNSAVNMGEGKGLNAPAPTGGGAGQTTQAPTGNGAASAQELEELEDLQTKLDVRARSANDSVENLRKQMAATGNNLRADVSASQNRMRIYMGKFDAAMAAGDAVAAKKYMGMAEREVENLEKFFGN